MAEFNWLDQGLAFGPEIVLVLGALIILTLDLIQDDDRSARLPIVTFVTLVLALAWSLVSVPASLFPGVGQGTVFGMFALDNLTYFFRVFALATGLLVLVLTVDYLRGRSRDTGEFYALLLFVTLAVILTAASNNLVLLYLSFEFLSITSYIMVGWLRGNPRSTEASMKYLLYGSISSAIMLYGMSLLYGASGTLDVSGITDFSGSSGGEASSFYGVGVTAAVLMMVGFGFKAALVPFHQWSPDAYEGAPTPVTTFLAVGPKAAAFAIIIRVLGVGLQEQVPAWQTMLSIMAMLTMVVGNLTALLQSDMKRTLAYSSIAQAGYILMGIAANDPTTNNGLRAVLIYLLAYLFTNVGLSVAVVAFEEDTGSTTIADYRGLVARSPFLAGAMVIFFLSLLGIPPTAGFLGKFLVFGTAINQGFYLLAIVGVLTSVISAYYYLNVVRTMFFRSEAAQAPVRFPTALKIALGVTLAGTLLMNIFPGPFFDLIGDPMQLVAQIPF